LLLALLALLLLLLLPSLALLLVELEIFPLVLDCSNAVGALCATSVATSKTALFPGGFQHFGVVYWLWLFGHRCESKSGINHLL
jgi:hypothetical protein